VPVLVDAAPVPLQSITEIAEGVPGVHSVHNVRARMLGGEMFVEMHLHIAANLEEDHILSHAITEAVEKKLEKEFGKVTATIHVEPLPEEVL
jgi:divalent metal cation (Fe/Co/Zn/Cd) transporter